MATTQIQSEMTCDLPLDLIKKSPGFSFDIGSSVAKLVYRPKEEFSQGVPKAPKEGRTKGSLRLVSLPRNDTHQIAEYLKSRCDLSDNQGESPIDVSVTGVGSQSFKHSIQKELNVKLHVKPEFDCFVDAFRFMSRNLPATDLFFPLSQEYLQKAQKMAIIFVMMIGEKRETPGSERDEIPTSPKKPEFPCLLATAGSAMDLKLVEEDGTFTVLEGNFFSGRALLGISKLLTGTSDFAEIIRMVESTDGRTVDAYTTDAVDVDTTSGKKEGDLYSDMPEFRMFPFGKAVHADPDSLKKEDMVHSILESMCENLAVLAHSTALIHGITGVYFSGSLTMTQRVRDWITQFFWQRNLALPLEKRRELQFLRHGSHLGAIGAFMEGATEQKST